MKQVHTIRIWILFLWAAGFLTACNLPTETAQENYNLFQGLEAVEGAEEVTVTIEQGSAVGRDAYFEFTIDNVNSQWIQPGVYDGWCIEWTKPIAQQGDTHEGIQIYSTYGEDLWKPLNYLLNIKDELQAQDPALSFTEFQAVIWSIQEGPEFDINTLSKDEIPPRLLKDGELNFSKAKVHAIIEDVRTNAPAFEYTKDKTVALFMKTDEDEQDVMVPSDPPADSVSHGYVEGVTPSDDPRFAERTYPVIQADWEGPGGDKRWLGWNLGATEAPESLVDDDPENAGWFFQFNRSQGYFHDGVNRIPNTEWEVNRDDPGKWNIENDPCRELLGGTWRIPTLEEWESFYDHTGDREVPIDAFESELALHMPGVIDEFAELNSPTRTGIHWSYDDGWAVVLGPSTYGIGMFGGFTGASLRCIED